MIEIFIGVCELKCPCSVYELYTNLYKINWYNADSDPLACLHAAIINGVWAVYSL